MPKQTAEIFIPSPPSSEYAEEVYRHRITQLHSVFIYFHLFFALGFFLSRGELFIEVFISGIVLHFIVISLQKAVIQKDRNNRKSSGLSFVSAHKNLLITVTDKHIEGPEMVESEHSDFLNSDLYNYSLWDSVLLKTKAKRIWQSGYGQRFSRQTTIDLNNIDWERSLKQEQGFKTITAYQDTKTILVHPIFSDKKLLQIKELCQKNRELLEARIHSESGRDLN